MQSVGICVSVIEPERVFFQAFLCPLCLCCIGLSFCSVGKTMLWWHPVGVLYVKTVIFWSVSMSIFEQVSVVREANIYFEGKVTSRIVQFADGSKKTLGIMLPGEYTFSTDAAEVMEILQGEMVVLLPGEAEWKTIGQGQSFDVPAKSEFNLKITNVVDYCCSYLEG